MNKGSKEPAHRSNRPVAPDVDDVAWAPRPGVQRNLPGYLLWAGAGLLVAMCIAILLIWGIHGPTYLFDLIAAYCL
jgi:hypothetical protein